VCSKAFSDVDDENITPEGILPQNSLEPSSMAIPLHILSLRRIASKIAKNVYSKTLKVENREDVIRDLHKELIDWRRNMPFPLPDLHANVPHYCSSWYDLNFYVHLAMLYRPSPLFPTLDQARVKILAEAASMSIRQASNMHRQRRFAYNWLNLLSVYTAALSLIYAVTAQPDSLVSVLRESRAIDDLELVLELFDTLSFKFKAVKNIRNMIQEILTRYKELSSSIGSL
jgi:hypothetical protein